MTEEGELPEGWSAASMGDISEVVGGGTPKASDPVNFAERGHPWITPADLSGFRSIQIRRGRRDLSDAGLRSSSAKMVPAGTVLMSSRAPIGYLAIAENPVCTNQGFRSFVCGPKVLPEYVFYWLTYCREEIRAMGSGSTFAEVSGSRCKEIPIRFPCVAEQERIAAVAGAAFTSVTDSQDRLASVRTILRRFRQAVLAAACDGRLTETGRDQIERSDDWPTVTLDSVAESFSYGTAAKSSSTGRVPVLRMGNIQDGQLDWTNLVYTSDAREIAKYRLSRGDVLFNRTNSPELVGKTAVYRGEREAVYAGYLIRVRCTDRLLPDFLNYSLNGPAGKEYLASVRTDGVSQSNINAKSLAAFEFGLPSVAEQREIVRRIEALFSLADAVEKRVASATSRADKLTQAILAKAFRGELVPTEAELARRRAAAGISPEPKPAGPSTASRRRPR